VKPYLLPWRHRQRGFLINPYALAVTGGGPTDPSFANVVSLLHFNGADGGTTFTDQKGKTWTASGTPTTSTAQFVYGTASLLDATAQSHIVTASHADFGYGTGDWTIEFWFRPSSLSGGAQGLYDQRTAGGQPRPCIFTLGGGDLRYHASGADRITAPGGTIVVNTWAHIAVCKVSGTTRMFKDGTQVGSNYTDAINYETSGAMIGNFGDQPANTFGTVGNYDDFRATKGVGRYAANFTAPPAQFPDS